MGTNPYLTEHRYQNKSIILLREKVAAAVKVLKIGKTDSMDNTPAELVQIVGETMIDILT